MKSTVFCGVKFLLKWIHYQLTALLSAFWTLKLFRYFVFCLFLILWKAFFLFNDKSTTCMFIYCNIERNCLIIEIFSYKNTDSLCLINLISCIERLLSCYRFGGFFFCDICRRVHLSSDNQQTLNEDLVVVNIAGRCPAMECRT